MIVLVFPILLVCFFGLKKGGGDTGSGQDEVESKGEGVGLRAVVADSRWGLEGGGIPPLTSLNGPLAGMEKSPQKIKKLVDFKSLIDLRDSNFLSQLSREEIRELKDYLDRMSSAANKDRPWVCWGENVSPAKLAAYHEIEKMVGLAGPELQISANQFQSNGRWSKTATDGFDFGSQGDASTLTWSIVPDGTPTPGLTNQSETGSDFRAWMASIYGGSANGAAADQPWFALFENAFDEIAATCGLTLVYEPMDDGASVESANSGELRVRGDIRIAARALDGNSGNLAIAFQPDQGDMVFDSSDGTFFITAGDSIRLFNTITHELGHCLGLAHVCPINQTKLLEPSLTTSFRGPQFDEFQSLQRLYGDRFEVHEDFRDNDTTSAAKEINLVEGSPVFFSRLSIDDDRDRDFYRFEGVVGQRLNVNVVPGEGGYLEGEDGDLGCTQAVGFDSTSIHDLSVQVLGDDGVTVIFESVSGGLGEPESIELFELPSTGAFYLLVEGEPVNATQIYELQAELITRLPAPRLNLLGHRVLEESGAVKNGRLDPGETIRLAMDIKNEGELPTGALTTNLLALENAVIFWESAPLQLVPGESGVIEVVVGTIGSCGDILALDLEVRDASGALLNQVFKLEAGMVTRSVAFEVDFEGLNNLSIGWSSNASGSGEEWSVVSTRSDSRFRSAFSPARDSIGESFLLSEIFELASSGGTLKFNHLFRLEPGFDGGVLEVSRDGEEWTDLVTNPDVIVTGGYNRGIRDGFGSTIAGQLAWSGLQSVPESVSIELPTTWAEEMIQFRWRVVHDASSARDGWWIDDVRMEMLVEDCEQHRPAVSLEFVSGQLNENDFDSRAILKLGANLPLVTPLSVSLEVSGSASLSQDYELNRQVVLPSGAASVEIPIEVIPDLVTEGEEIVLIEIPSDGSGFVSGNNSSVSLTILDVVNVETWSMKFFGGAVNLLGDSDGDGFDEISEYVLGTNPRETDDWPSLAIIPRNGRFLLPLGEFPDRVDANLGIEFSGDLRTWEAGVLVKVPGGLEITPITEKSYFRLTFSLD